VITVCGGSASQSSALEETAVCAPQEAEGQQMGDKPRNLLIPDKYWLGRSRYVPGESFRLGLIL
jgi:hypothetical protein